MTGIEVSGSAGHWQAMAGGERVGALHAIIRPDRRCFVFFDGCREDAYRPLLAAANNELDRDLYTVVGEDDRSARWRLAELGFGEGRHERVYRVAIDPPHRHRPGLVAPPLAWT